MSAPTRVTSVDHTDRSRGGRMDRPSHAVADGRQYRRESSPPGGVALHHHVRIPTPYPTPSVVYAAPAPVRRSDPVAVATHVVAGSGHMPSVAHTSPPRSAAVYAAPAPAHRPTHVVAGSGHMPSVVHATPHVTHHVPFVVNHNPTPTYIGYPTSSYGFTPPSMTVHHHVPRRHSYSTVHVADSATCALIGAIAMMIIGLALTVFAIAAGGAAGIPVAIVGLALAGAGGYLTWKNCNAQRV